MNPAARPDLPAIALPSPPGTVAAVALHASLHLRRTIRLRRIWPALLLIALTVAAAAGIARVSAGEPRALLTFLSSLGVRVVGLIGLGFGTRALRADADHGALSAFLLRPRAELALPLGRFVATSLIVATLAVILVLAVQGAAFAFALPLAWERMPFVLSGMVTAALGYTALFLFFAAIVRPAAAVGLAWLVLIDLGLGNVSDTFARLTPGPSVAKILEFDPDLSLFGSAGVDLWLALGGVVLLSALCLAGALWRFRGDAPA